MDTWRLSAWRSAAAVSTSALFLLACGGAEPPPGEVAAPRPAPAPSAPLLAEVVGTVTFDHVPNVQGKLDYAATTARPARGVTVELVQPVTEKILATTVTDAQGRYVAALEPEVEAYVRVKAQLFAPGRWDVRILDNTEGDALYALESAVFRSGTPAPNVHAPSGWGRAAYVSSRSAAPFAILDTIYRAQAKLLEVDAAAVFPSLLVHWSPANRPASGDLALGEIGTSHFTRGSDQSRIYILGAANVDTDEYDDSVVAHEWGHYYEEAFGRLHSIGGAHSGADALEMTVAFSEGWGNAWSGIVLEREDYSDSLGLSQAGGFSYSFAPQSPPNAGWYNEHSVGYVLHSFANAQGVGPMHRAMVGMRELTTFASLHSFSAAMRRQDGGAADALDVLLVSQGTAASAGGDEYGTTETNFWLINSTWRPWVAEPIYQPLALGQPADVCTLSAGAVVQGAVGAPNKLPNHRFLRFDAPQAGQYRMTVTAIPLTDGGGDPDLSGLIKRRRVVLDNAVGNVDVQVELPSGPAVFVVSDYDVLSGLRLFACMTVEVNVAAGGA